MLVQDFWKNRVIGSAGRYCTVLLSIGLKNQTYKLISKKYRRYNQFCLMNQVKIWPHFPTKSSFYLKSKNFYSGTPNSRGRGGGSRFAFTTLKFSKPPQIKTPVRLFGIWMVRDLEDTNFSYKNAFSTVFWLESLQKTTKCWCFLNFHWRVPTKIAFMTAFYTFWT